MTAVDADALEAARAAATAGPWEVPPGFEKVIDGFGPHMAIVQCDHIADAALIVAAVNALEPLIAAVRERDALRAAVEGLTAEYDANGGWDLDYSARLRALLADVNGGGQR